MAEELTCELCNDGRVFSRPGHLANHKKWKHRDLFESPPVAGVSDAGSDPSATGDGGALSDLTGEVRPGSPGLGESPPEKPTLLGRLKKPRPSLSPTSEKRPGSHKRVSTADFWASFVLGGSTLLGRAGYVPTARAIAWSAPIAGEIIEDPTKDTVVDRWVQPLARNADKWEKFFRLMELWVGVGMAEMSANAESQATTPEERAAAGARRTVAMQIARNGMTALLPDMAKAIRAQRKKEQDAAAAITELMPDLAEMGVDMNDPVGGLLEGLFAGPPMPVPADNAA